MRKSGVGERVEGDPDALAGEAVSDARTGLQQLPGRIRLNRQAERYAREGAPISLSALADQVGAGAAVLMPLFHRLLVYVRADRQLGGPAPPGKLFYYSRDRGGEHPQSHLDGYAGHLQADTYGGYGKLYESGRKSGLILEAACWV